jgi:hypothetical protein
LIRNPVSGLAIEVDLVIDTGADATILDVELARILGLRPTRDGERRVRGIAGNAESEGAATVEIELTGSPDLRFTVEATFLTGLQQTVGNLLGLDFLYYVDLALSHADRTVTFTRHD